MRLPRLALVCVGTWLNAAETMMTATIMPSVATEIHGNAWFGWAIAIYLVGSILAGATAAWLAQVSGLKRALASAGLVYVIGCAVAASAKTIDWFIVGRLVQGTGGGWITGLCFITVTRLFPQSLWARVLSVISGIWGAASLVSPLIGGLFATAGIWRGAFWLFAIQGLGFIAAAIILLPAPTAPEPVGRGRVPLAALAALTGAIIAIATAGLVTSLPVAAILSAAGLALLAAFLYLNLRADAPLIPRQAADPRTGTGAGLAMIFCLTTGTAGINAYLPALVQKLYGASPLLAGYLLISEALSFTLAAFLVAGRRQSRRFIRAGAVIIALGLALLALIVPRGGLWLVFACALIEGVGLGLAWPAGVSRLVANAPAEERAIASASTPAAQAIGTAVGSAACGVIAGLIGFGSEITLASAIRGAFWLFAAFVPLTVLGAFAAWRLTSSRFDPSDTGATC